MTQSEPLSVKIFVVLTWIIGTAFWLGCVVLAVALILNATGVYR